MVERARSERSQMRVLILPSWYPPNGGWFFRDQAHFIRDAGADVAVLCPTAIGIRQVIRHPSQLKAAVGRTSVVDDSGVATFTREWITVPSRGRLDPAGMAWVADRMFEHVVREWGMPRLLHAHSTMWGGYAAYMLSQKHGIPYVITEHRGRFSLPSPEADHLLPGWSRAYIAKALRHPSRVILVGSGLLRQIQPMLPAHVPVDVIPNGVDTRYFTPVSERVHSPFVFVFVGVLSEQKGVRALVQAFAKVRRSFEARLLLVGDGPERRWIEEYVEEHALHSDVVLRGHQEPSGVRDALRSADTFVLPSDFEGLPVSVIEALATGLPAIVSESAPPELLGEGMGVRVPVRNPEELGDAMSTMIREATSYDRRKIRRFAVEEYDFRAVARRLMQVYSECSAQV